jgi:predicted ATPase
VTRRILLTGGPGFGKSSIIAELERMGYDVFPEIARQIIQQQVISGGTITPWQDIETFSAQVLDGRKEQFVAGQGKISFYDRGVPDIAAFLKKEKKVIPELLWNYCMQNQYFTSVFITPPWEAIFRRDEERKEDFMDAIKVHRAIESIYNNLGYELIPIPMGTITWRAQYLLNKAGIR